MKAAQLVAPKRFEIVDVPAPNLAPQSMGAIIVKVELAGICGSDIATFAYEHPPTEYPFPPGLSAHECIGVISASRSLSSPLKNYLSTHINGKDAWSAGQINQGKEIEQETLIRG